MQHITTKMRWSYLLVLMIGVLGLTAIPAQAQQVFFNPSTLQLEVGETALVEVHVANIPTPGLAAFQFTLGFQASVVNVLNPNEAFRNSNIDPFVPLGDNAFCTIVRGTATCPDPSWFLTSTGRSPTGTDSIDNATGRVQVAYGTSGTQVLPTGDGIIALIEVEGIVDGATTINIDPTDFILADNSQPPQGFDRTGIGVLSVIVGTPPPRGKAQRRNPSK